MGYIPRNPRFTNYDAWRSASPDDYYEWICDCRWDRGETCERCERLDEEPDEDEEIARRRRTFKER